MEKLVKEQSDSDRTDKITGLIFRVCLSVLLSLVIHCDLLGNFS